MELLTAILVRYPEVATINFAPDRQVLEFNFIASRALSRAEKSALKGRLAESIEVFNLLEERQVRIKRVDHRSYGNLTIIRVQRDVESLVQEEIALMVEVLRHFLGEDLVAETNEAIYEEELILRERLIKHMLDGMRYMAEEKHLFAFREGGRVLVFNKQVERL